MSKSYANGLSRGLRQTLISSRKDETYQNRPPNWSGHRTYLSIAAAEQSLNTFSIADGNELALPQGLFHAWLVPLLWCGMFFAGCDSLMGPYLPTLAKEKYGMGLPEMSMVFSINRAATAIGGLLAYWVINATNGRVMLKSGPGLAGVCFVAYGGMYYLNASDVTEYMGSTAILYGIAGLCRAFFLVFTLTTLFYHYAKKFRLYICLFEFLNGLGATACIMGSFYLFEQMRAPIFFVIGGCLIFGSTFVCALSADRALPTKRSTVTSRSCRSLLCNVGLLIDTLTIAMAWISIAYFDNYIYVKVTEIEGQADMARIIFLFTYFYGSYAAGTFVFGTIGLIWRTEAFTAIIVQGLAVIGFVVGTSVYKEIEAYLNIEEENLRREQVFLTASMILIGFAAGGQTIPMMKKLVRDTMNRGFARTIWTMSSISTTIVVASSSLACFACLITGFVGGHFGSPALAFVMFGMNAFWFIVRIISYAVSWLQNENHEENFAEYSDVE